MLFSDSKILKHSLANPITNILSFLESYSNKSNQDLNAALYNARYVQSILKTINPHQKNQKKFNLKQSINQILYLIKKPDSLSKIYLHFNCDPLLELKGNPIYLQESIICLINNAFESYDIYQLNKIVKINITSNNQFLYIKIKDYGKGMNFFEQKVCFFKGKSSKSSHLGIGLYMTKKIIKTKFNGNISIQSKKNFGTIITLKIPLTT